MSQAIFRIFGNFRSRPMADASWALERRLVMSRRREVAAETLRAN